MKPSDLDAMPSDEYELDARTTGSTPPTTPQPLPRMWKADDSDPEIGSKANKAGQPGIPGIGSSHGQSSPVPSRKSAGSEPPSREGKKSPQASSSQDDSEDPDKKKVLVEETPEWDTYETRRRARLFLGAAMGSVILLIGWAGYRLIFHDPNAFDESDGAAQVQGGGSPPPNLDLEARAMIDRAKEHDRGGRRDESVALLEKVVKVYPRVPAAKIAYAALARAKQAQPLFPDPPAGLTEVGIPPDGIPPSPTDLAKGMAPAQPPAGVNQTRPPDAAQGLARATPAPVKHDLSVAPVPVPSVDPSRTAPEVSPAKPSMNPLPRGYRARTDEGIHESGWPQVIEGELDKSLMVFIPEGTFIMGANQGPIAESPAHRVRLRAFYIDQHEVTIDQFNKFMDQTGYRRLLPRNWVPGDGKARQESTSNPVTMVTFKDAEAYAEWSQRQLPTEAQWEMAARSPVSHIYPWGSEPISWAKLRAHHQVDPVMSFPQDVTVSGAFDMGGNVAEWTRDWFDLRYFQQFADTAAIEPTGPTRGSRTLQRVIKGGSRTWHASHREGMPQEKRLGYVGFRCVLNINSAPIAPPTTQPAPSGQPDLTPAVPF